MMKKKYMSSGWLKKSLKTYAPFNLLTFFFLHHCKILKKYLASFMSKSTYDSIKLSFLPPHFIKTNFITYGNSSSFEFSCACACEWWMQTNSWKFFIRVVLMSFYLLLLLLFLIHLPISLTLSLSLLQLFMNEERELEIFIIWQMPFCLCMRNADGDFIFIKNFFPSFSFSCVRRVRNAN